MTDNEIIKLLECCKKSQCSKCYYSKECDGYTQVNYALDLINRQKSEIERLKGFTIVNNIMESQRIKREAKAEAVKEFAMKLQAFCKEIMEQEWNEKTAPISWSYAYAGFIDDIDTLLKEMVGDDSGQSN